jgi:hypothetical protein
MFACEHFMEHISVGGPLFDGMHVHIKQCGVNIFVTIPWVISISASTRRLGCPFHTFPVSLDSSWEECLPTAIQVTPSSSYQWVNTVILYCDTLAVTLVMVCVLLSDAIVCLLSWKWSREVLCLRAWFSDLGNAQWALWECLPYADWIYWIKPLKNLPLAGK